MARDRIISEKELDEILATPKAIVISGLDDVMQWEQLFDVFERCKALPIPTEVLEHCKAPSEGCQFIGKRLSVTDGVVTYYFRCSEGHIREYTDRLASLGTESILAESRR
jgi:hypothetical protein